MLGLWQIVLHTRVAPAILLHSMPLRCIREDLGRAPPASVEASVCDVRPQIPGTGATQEILQPGMPGSSLQGKDKVMPRCEFCGEWFTQPRGGGRPRVYCDAICRDAADRARKARRRAARRRLRHEAQRPPERANAEVPPRPPRQLDLYGIGWRRNPLDILSGGR